MELDIQVIQKHLFWSVMMIYASCWTRAHQCPLEMLILITERGKIFW